MVDISELTKQINKMAKFKTKKIDTNSKQFKKRLERLHKVQKECLDRKKIDWEKMSRTYITI
jgi:hypothetical protein